MELARVQIRNVQFLNGLIRRVFNVKVARGSWKKGNRARRLQYLKTCLVHTAGALRRLGGWRGDRRVPAGAGEPDLALHQPRQRPRAGRRQLSAR